jgi:N-methylhydantoinase B/oxoprolinase/acetone carboxylase alpha subunit
VSNAPVNAARACTHAAVYAAMLSCIDSDAPMSSGCFDLIDIQIPERSILNASWPAPLFAGPADIGNRTAETVIRAFAQIDQNRVTAGSYATGNNSVAFGTDSHGEEFLWYVFEAGGCGARRELDGNSGEWHLMSNAKNESMEIWEARYPVRFEFYRLVPNSGGAGRKRGGLGTERGIRVLCDTTVSALADRHKIPPWGINGGLEGTCNAIRIERDGKIYRPSELGAPSDSKFGGLRLKAGDVYIVRQGGGGGFGRPEERSAEEVALDVAAGYITPDHARKFYEWPSRSMSKPSRPGWDE